MIRRPQISIGIGLTALASALFAGPLPAQDVLKIGVLGVMSGPAASWGLVNKYCAQASAELYNEQGGFEIGGKKYKIEIKYYDDESNAQRATALVERLITEDKVNFVTGPYGSGSTFPASSVAEKYGIPMVIAHGASTTIYDRGYKCIFAVLTSVDQYTINMINMAAGHGAKSIGLISENALFPKLGIDGAAAQAKQAGLQIDYQD